MKNKILVTTLLSFVALTIFGCGSTESNTSTAEKIVSPSESAIVEEKNVSPSESTTAEEKNVSSSESVTAEFDVVYDFASISKDFWESYEYGIEENGMNNNDVFLKRKQSLTNSIQGELQIPNVEYTNYAKIDGEIHKFTFNVGGWLYPANVGAMSEKGDDRFFFYALCSDLSFITCDVSLEKNKNYERNFANKNEPIDTVGGWEVYSYPDGVKMFSRINDEFLLSIQAYNSTNLANSSNELSEEKFKYFYTMLANSFVYEGIADEEVAHVALPNDYTAAQLGDVVFDISNYKITSWLANDNKGELYINIINFEDDNHWYKINEYLDVTSIDEIVEVFTENDNNTAENYELNGITGVLIYANSNPEHFAFQSGDHVYLITFYDANISDITFVQEK